MISAPKDIYGPNLFAIFLSELGISRVCEILDVRPATVRAWVRGKHRVPQMAVRALYWETCYGRSMIETGFTNEIRILYRRISILENQYLRAKDIITGLRRLHAGTANEPVFEELEDCYAKEGIQAQLGSLTTLQSSAAVSAYPTKADVRFPARPQAGQDRSRQTLKTAVAA